MSLARPYQHLVSFDELMSFMWQTLPGWVPDFRHVENFIVCCLISPDEQIKHTAHGSDHYKALYGCLEKVDILYFDIF